MTIVLTDISLRQLGPLAQHGMQMVETKSTFERARFTGLASLSGITFILYTSGRLVIQHGKDQENQVEQLLAALQLRTVPAPVKKQSTQMTLGQSDTRQAESLDLPVIAPNHIGSDEALKGDTFGGLVVCAFAMKKDDAASLINLGVKDSKLLTDEQIRRIASALQKDHPDKFCVRSYLPQEYNEQIAQGKKVTALLNELHTWCARELQEKATTPLQHVVDKYPGCTAGDLHIEKAESLSLAVAAASILARAKGLEQFDILSTHAGFTLPLGSTHVDAALLRLKKEGKDLNVFAKTSFRNVQEYL